jgi:hypothetical protein
MSVQKGLTTKLPKGLATVALLKSNFDAGHDHIGMFQPFVLDSIRSLPAPDFLLEEIREQLAARHGLAVPVHSLRVLLNRAVHDKYIRREAGRYSRVALLDTFPDITSARARIEADHTVLGAELQAHAAKSGVRIESPNAALSLLLDFLAENQVELFLADPLRTPPDIRPSDPSKDQLKVVATYVAGLPPQGPQLVALRRMLEGLVLQQALLLRDIGSANRYFEKLQVYLDTNIIFRALGLEGEAEELATQQMLQMLRLAGAHLAVFENTIEEMKRVLVVCEERLATTAGRLSLYPTPLTRYLLKNKYGPADVRTVIALLPKQIQGLGASIKPIPPHDERYTLDETKLAALLKRKDRPAWEPRVVHDVSCVAAIVTLRRGHASDFLDGARAIFVTGSRLVLKHVNDWWAEAKEAGIGPAIHDITISNAAWLKRPAAAADLKLQELVALCSAALQPSRRIWDAFQVHLRKLVDMGNVSSDEAIAVVVSSLTDRLLFDLDDDDDVPAESLAEVVERVKASYRAEAEEAKTAAEKAQKNAEGTVARERLEATAEVARVRAEADISVAARTEEARQERLRVENAARRIAHGIVLGVKALLLLAVIMAAGLSLPKVFEALSVHWQAFAWVVLAVVAVLSAIDLFFGVHVTGLTAKLEDWIAVKVRATLFGLGTETRGDGGPIEL